MRRPCPVRALRTSALPPVREIIQDLMNRGYEGGLSIEPHLAAVVHTGEESGPEKLYESYVTYGRRLSNLVERLGK